MKKFYLWTILSLQIISFLFFFSFIPSISIAEMTTVNQQDNFQELTQKAKQNDVEAQYKLAVMYFDGNGVAKNEIKAIAWFKKAAENGSSDASFNLGLIYDKGLGVPKNSKLAFKWYNDAAILGDADAAYKVSIMYADAEGTPRDLVNAYAWISVAIQLGTLSKELKPLAVKFRDELKNNLSSEDYKKAEKIAGGYLAIQEGLGIKKQH